MSSSVSTYVSAEELRRQREAALAAAQARLRRQELRLAEVRRRAQDARSIWGEDVKVPAEIDTRASSEVAAVDAMTGRLEAAVAAAAARIDTQVHAARVRLMSDAIARISTDTPDAKVRTVAEVFAEHERSTSSQAARSRSAHSEPSPDTETPEEIIARALDILVGIDVTAAQRDLLATQAEALKRADSPARRDLAARQLKLNVQQIRERARAAAERLVQIDRLERLLDGCDVPEAQSIRAKLLVLRHGDSPLSAAHRVEVDAALAAQDEAEVRETLRAVLARSFDVGPDFSTELATDGVTRVLNPRRAGYGVKVRVKGDPRRLFLTPIQDHESTLDVDYEVTAEFCAAVPDLIAEMEAAGLDLEPPRIIDPDRPPDFDAKLAHDTAREESRSTRRAPGQKEMRR